MPDMRNFPVSYAPRGVVKKVIALRLLAPELAKHETLVESRQMSSASLAREIYLLGVEQYEQARGATEGHAP